MYLKSLRAISFLVLIFVFSNTAFVADESDKNNQDSDNKMIQYFLSNIKSENDSMVSMLRDTVNSDPDKYLPILNECKGKFGLQANKIVYQYILGLEKYNESKELIGKIGEIVNLDFEKSQLAIVERNNDSNIGWIVGSKSGTDLFLMLKTLKIENYDTRYYEYKILDWRVIYERDSGNYRGSKEIDSYYIAAEMGLWAWIGLCKKDYITSGLAYNASEQIIYKHDQLETQTKPKYAESLEHGKQKIQEILADYKLKQIKDSTRFDNSFENILKSLQALNKAFSIKSDTKTEVNSLTQQFENTKKFLDDTSTEEEQNKPINKLIREIILGENTGLEPDSYNESIIGLGGSLEGGSIPYFNENKQTSYSSLLNIEINRVWDSVGDLIPEHFDQLVKLLECRFITVHFSTVGVSIAKKFQVLTQKEFKPNDTLNYATKDNLKAVEWFFGKMPKTRNEFYVSLHHTYPDKRWFSVWELTQTSIEEAKKLLLQQTNDDDLSNIILQFSMFIKQINQDNFDSGFFQEVFNSKFQAPVCFALTELLWNKFQSTLGFNRVLTDLQNTKKQDEAFLDNIKARINLLQVMSHTSKDHAEAFKALVLNLMECENKIVQYAIFQIFEKYGVPDSFVEKVQATCNDTEILFHKPDVDNFPMMISNLAKSIIAQKNEMPGSYRPNASYFDRKMMFEFILKYLGKDNKYDELLKKYKVEKEEVPEDLGGLKQLIDEYLYSKDQNKKAELHDEILKSPGAWDALRLSGRGKSENELQILLKLADDVSRKIKVVEHLTKDKSDEKFISEINKLKGESLTYFEMTELTKNLSNKYNLKEVAVYAERLTNGLGTRLLIYTVKSDEEISEKNSFSDILAAKYTRNGISQLIKNTDFSDVKGENLLGRAIEGINYVSSKFITSQLEFYYHIKH